MIGRTTKAMMLVPLLLATSSCGRRARRTAPSSSSTSIASTQGHQHTQYLVLEFRRARPVGVILREHLGDAGLRVSWDGWANQVIVTGSKDLVARAADLARNMDIERYIAVYPINVYRLKHLVAGDLVPMLREVASALASHRVATSRDDPFPASTVRAHGTNALVVCGDKDDFDALKSLLDEIDV